MIIETDHQLSMFLQKFDSQECIIIPIFESENTYARDTELLFIFIKFSDDSWIAIPISHPECILKTSIKNIFINYIINNLKNKKYIINKKYLINYLKNKKIINKKNILYNLIDINILFYLNNKNIFKIKNNYYNISKKIKNKNKFISIVKWIEFLNDISVNILNDVLKIKETINSISYKYLDESLNTISNLELNGMYVTDDFFNSVNNFKNENDSLIFQDINLFNMTGRLSSVQNGFNFFAIPKKSEYLNFMVSRHKDSGKLLLIDFKAFHLYLIASIIDYKFSEYPYDHFAKYLLGGSGNYDKNIIKKIVFKNLYGEPLELKDHEFFKSLSQLKTEVWNYFKSNNYYETLTYKRRVYSNATTESQLFAHFLQSVESEFTLELTKEINEFLYDTKSKLILSIFDSFIFDMHTDDENKIEQLTTLINKNNFSTSNKYGNSFSELFI